MKKLAKQKHNIQNSHNEYKFNSMQFIYEKFWKTNEKGHVIPEVAQKLQELKGQRIEDCIFF